MLQNIKSFETVWGDFEKAFVKNFPSKRDLPNLVKSFGWGKGNASITTRHNIYCAKWIPVGIKPQKIPLIRETFFKKFP